MKKRIAVLILAVLMVAVLGGCGKVDTSKYGTTEVIKLGDQSIYLDELNYYLRTNQYEREAAGYLTANNVKTWDEEINYYGIVIYTLKEELLFDSVAELRQIYVLCDQAAKQNITLSADEEAKVVQAAKDFLEKSDEKLVSYVNLSEERLVEVLRRNALANKMYEASIADVDTTVTKEEALQYDVTTVYLSASALQKIEDLEEGATPKSLATAIADRVNDGEKLADVLKDYDGLTSSSRTMGDGDNEDTFGKIVPDLKVGEAGTVAYSSAGAYYVVVRDSDYNEKATETKKEQMAEQKLADHFAKVYAEWEEAIEFEPEYKMIDNLPVSEQIYEKSSSADSTTEAADGTTEAADSTTEAADKTTEADDETEGETE